MFWIIFFLLFAILTIISFCRQNFLDNTHRENKNGWRDLGVIFCVITVIVIASGTGRTLAAYTNQKYDNERLTQVSQFQDILQKRADSLTSKFAHYLAEVYPEHEKNIFEKIKPEDCDIYLAKYPELKSSDTIIQLVIQIRSLQDDFYKQQLTRAEILRDMRYRKKSPWVLQFLMPNIEVPAV